MKSDDMRPEGVSREVQSGLVHRMLVQFLQFFCFKKVEPGGDKLRGVAREKAGAGGGFECERLNWNDLWEEGGSVKRVVICAAAARPQPWAVALLLTETVIERPVEGADVRGGGGV